MNIDNRKGLTSFHLKLIAVICMLIDHSAHILYDYVGDLYTPMRIIGRIAFPIYCYLLVEGFVHTRNPAKYAGRLGLFCLISEPFFDLAFNDCWWYSEKQNVFFTLFLGFLAIWAMDTLKKKLSSFKHDLWLLLPAQGVIIVVSCLLASFLKTDYSFRGVLFICVFYLFRKRPWISMVLFTAINFMCGYRLTMLRLLGWEVGKQYLFSFQIQDMAILALFPMILYNRQKGKSMKWFFYIFYPAHLLVLYLILQLIKL